jgi:hypothetical protein
MKKISVLIGVMLVAFVGLGAAQASSQSGYYPIEEMGIFAQGDLEVDVDLSGAMLRVAAGAMETQDESLAALAATLERVRVQVGNPSGVDAATVARKMADARATLGAAGWQKILSVQDTDEQVYLYALENGGNIAGLTAFVNGEDEEVVVVNIVGDINPEALGRLLANLKDLDLDELMEAAENSKD